MNFVSKLEYGERNLLNEVDVTILMPIFNHNKYLLESIESALRQTTRIKFAVLIVDNDAANEYNNLDIVKSTGSNRIVYFKNSVNIGAVGNWNQCLNLARSKYVLFLHDDDRLKENAIDYLWTYIQKYPYYAIIGNTDFINEESVYIQIESKKLEPYLITSIDLLINNACSNGVGSMFLLDSLKKIGGFKQEDYPCIDYAFFSKYVLKYGALRTRVSTADIRLAENATLSCYPEMADSNRKVRYFLINAVNLPHWFLKFFIGLSYIQEQEYLYATYSELPCPCKDTKAKRMMYRCCLKVLRLYKRFQLLSYAKKNRS